MKFQLINKPILDLPLFKLIGNKVSKLSDNDYPELQIEFDYDDDGFPEGKVKEHLHKYFERSAKAVNQKKKNVLNNIGTLYCEVCGFDFVEIYGELGYGFAECHHLYPVSSLQPNHITKIGELCIVCSNCHRMIHKAAKTTGHLLTIIELQKIINNNQLGKRYISLLKRRR
ncbi:hypothetical protein SDC9_97320 [bioreactor metagenome]|uniref:HNH domain-containing protein n=1 Tax=bioreactor metagenome TaxID=1076179 RepID=A0A645AD01_9ZZZZ